MLDRDQIEAFAADARPHLMIEESNRVLAKLDEMAAHLPKDSRERDCVATAAGCMGDLITLLGAAIEDGAKLPEPEPRMSPEERAFYSGSQWRPEDIEKMRAASDAPAQFNKIKETTL